jgi:hypothetical protein
VEPTIADVTSSEKEETKEHDVPEKVQSSSNNAAETATPPFPECLALTKMPEPPAFNILGELQNLYVKIPLLQALHDVPIYARTMRDICVKNPGRKTKDPLTVHVMGDLSALMLGKTPSQIWRSWPPYCYSTSGKNDHPSSPGRPRCSHQYHDFRDLTTATITR